MVKKGLSILLLIIYLLVNFMPYVPYIYDATKTVKKQTEYSKSLVYASSDVNTGDIGYLKAITKRANNKKESKTPSIIIVNNLEFTPLFKKVDIRIFPLKDIEYMDYEMILVNHIKQPNSPPPKFVV